MRGLGRRIMMLVVVVVGGIECMSITDDRYWLACALLALDGRVIAVM